MEMAYRTQTIAVLARWAPLQTRVVLSLYPLILMGTAMVPQTHLTTAPTKPGLPITADAQKPRTNRNLRRRRNNHNQNNPCPNPQRHQKFYCRVLTQPGTVSQQPC